MQFPLFPVGSKLINPSVGIIVDKEKTVWYLLGGSPVYFHSLEDQDKFRYVTSHLIELGHCSQAEVVRFFHVTLFSVQRYLKTYRDEG